MWISPKGFLRLCSIIVSLLLIIVACIGFSTLKISIHAVDTQAELGCLCFFCVCFGLLLILGESTWELFFSYFGFMRYRFGRVCIYTVSAVIVAILGKTRNQLCDCNDNVIFMIEGVALITMAAIQILAIFIFGNNSAPKCNKDSAQTICLPVASSLPARQPLKDTTQFQAIIQPIPPTSVSSPDHSAQTSTTSYEQSNLPSWMRTP